MGYDVSGEGVPIVFLHGIFVSRAQWSGQVKVLSKKHRVITLDLRGHGESSRNSDGYDIAELADDVVQLLDHLGIDRAVCCGHSFGGLVAQEVALRHPERLSGLILAETLYGMGTTPLEAMVTASSAVAFRFVEPRWMLSLFATYFGGLSGRGISKLHEEAGLHLQDEGNAYAILLASLAFGSRWRLHEISCPTLLLVGQLPQIPQVMLHAFEMRWRIPRAQLEMIPMAGHLVHWDNPDAFNRAVSSFVNGLSV